jgi:DNA-binding MarR family transcriptional regulator
MIRFTMKDFPKTASLERDDQGRLYDSKVREFLTSFMGPDKAQRLECFACLRWLMKETHQFSERWAEQHGLTEGRMQVLMRLRHGGDMPLGELAEQLRVSPRNVTGLVDHLERDGIVERVPDPADRRSVRAHLSEHGAQLLDRIWRESLERTLSLTEGISQEELDQLRHVCLRLVQNIESHRKEPAHTTPERSNT